MPIIQSARGTHVLSLAVVVVGRGQEELYILAVTGSKETTRPEGHWRQQQQLKVNIETTTGGIAQATKMKQHQCLVIVVLS